MIMYIICTCIFKRDYNCFTLFKLNIIILLLLFGLPCATEATVMCFWCAFWLLHVFCSIFQLKKQNKTKKRVELVQTTAMCSKHHKRALSCWFLCFAMKDTMVMLFLSLATSRQRKTIRGGSTCCRQRVRQKRFLSFTWQWHRAKLSNSLHMEHSVLFITFWARVDLMLKKK